MPHSLFDHLVHEAAAQWRERCLRNDGSVFSEKSLWTAENVGYLVKYFADNLDEGEGSFFEKLEAQLAPAPGGAKQLAAEMFWVMYLVLIPRSMQPGTKRRQIRMVWEWSDEPLPEAAFQLNDALNEGVMNPGPAFHTHRWREFLLLVRAMDAWKRLTESEREVHLADPWRFAAWLLALDPSQNRQLRHIICFLLFPKFFEPVATNYQKREILRAFLTVRGLSPDDVDYNDRIEVDQGLHEVRKQLVEDGGKPDFSFFDAEYLSVWRPEPVPGTGPGDDTGTVHPPSDDAAGWYAERFGEAKVWVMSAGQGTRWWDDFQRDRVIGIGWDDLGDLEELTARDDIHEKLRDIYGTSNPTNSSLACYEFAHVMQTGDHVIIKEGRSGLLGYGRITSEYEYEVNRPEFKHVRHVRWDKKGKKGQWPLPKNQWITTKTLTNFTDPVYHPWLQFAFNVFEGDTTLPPVSPPPEPPYSVDEALEDLFLERARFHEIMDTFERKMNIVLEGPPGVGKTFIAKRLAYRMIGYKAPARVRMIQFHQSYAYEDFIQGLRPQKDGLFGVQPGIFYTFCRKATSDPDNRYVFIIDEVNRGNLSKILGEAMMLIESDKRNPEYAVPLTYSPKQEFHVPQNVFLIGMMNTADRSLAMVDYALRRRFAFIRLEPAFGEEQFNNFLLDAGVEEDVVNRVVDRLLTLNKKIRDEHKNLGPGFEIGHSFFCPREGEEELGDSWYRSVVRREIGPLLREYWFDRPKHVEKLIKDLLA